WMNTLGEPRLQTFFGQHGGLVGQPQTNFSEVGLVERRRQKTYPLPGRLWMLGGGEDAVEVSLHQRGWLYHLGQPARPHRTGHGARIHPRQRPRAINT